MGGGKISVKGRSLKKLLKNQKTMGDTGVNDRPYAWRIEIHLEGGGVKGKHPSDGGRRRGRTKASYVARQFGGSAVGRLAIAPSKEGQAMGGKKREINARMVFSLRRGTNLLNVVCYTVEEKEKERPESETN